MIARGTPRIGKKTDKSKIQWFHLECIFLSFQRSHWRSETITSLHDIENNNIFSEWEKMRVHDLVEKHKRSRVFPALGTTRSKSEFLLKLYVALVELDSRYISWTSGSLNISLPPCKLLAAGYFRHQRFESFQRQLTNFGFRKDYAESSADWCVYTRKDLIGLPKECLLNLSQGTIGSSLEIEAEADCLAAAKLLVRIR